MALKYPNKLKRKGYWVRYENSGQHDFKKVWELILEIVSVLGLPFELSKKALSKLKFNEDIAIYVAIPIFMSYYDYTEREMQYELKTLVGNTLNHSNVNRWFQRVTPEYIKKAIKLLDKRIAEIYGEEDHYIGDSTGITSTLYKEILFAGEKVLCLICNKLHILVSYYQKYGVIVIKNLAVTHEDANDSPIFRNGLLRDVKVIEEKRVHLDKAYDAEENMKACFDLKLIPNIVPKDNDAGGIIRFKARKLYDDELRKKIRGLVEGVFGGLETGFGNKTRRRKPICRDIFNSILGLTHNIRTYLRALSDPFVY